MNKVIWLSLAMLAVVTTIGCSGADTPVSTPTPKPISESVDTTDDARVELGSWKATPPPIGFGGTITM